MRCGITEIYPERLTGAFAIRHYGRLIDRDDWAVNRNNYSNQRWEYEDEIYIIFMANGFILDIRKEV